MTNQVAKGSQAATIIAEEERLYGHVQARVALGDEADDRPEFVASDLDRDLLSLRDQISEARAEDLPPLIEQMTRLAALKARLGGGRSLPVDIMSPYFAHIRLREQGKTRDVLVGKRGFIDRQSNVQIVDWRNAPVSRIYYRYEEGDDYEEEIAGRRVEGVVEARRNVSIARGNLRRIGTPQGTYLKDSRGGWVEAVGTIAPVLHGGMGKAARPVAVAGAKGRLGVHHGAAARADKALPEIAALIDKEQFELITQPGSGIVVIQGGAGSGKTTVALHRIAYLHFNEPKRFKAQNTLFVVPTQSLVRYVGGVLPALGVAGVPVVTYTGWARTTRMKCLPDAPTKYNADPPEQVSRVKKHPAMLGLLVTVAEQQAKAIGGELGISDAAVAEWNRLVKRPLVSRLAGLASWLKKSAELEPNVRVALEVKVLVEAVRAPDGDTAKRSVTIAGDTAQRLVFDNNFSGWDQLLVQTGQPAIVRPLRLSYRSTAEVMVLAREILGPELAPEEPLAARPGEPVELHEFGDLGEAVAFLGDALRNLMARETTASCAVISRHAEQADAYFEGLRRAEVPALRRVRRDEFNFQPGVDVTDVAQVKGLEFDYVVMVDVNVASYPDVHWARHLMHIGVTRAAHQLWLISTGEVSSLVPAALRDGGRMGVG
jgi:hypothetical protein